MRFWLVCHGETEANVAGLYSGYTPTPLTGQGIAQAQTLGMLLRHVPVDSILCSELEHTRHTTQLILGDREVPARSMPELNETFSGDWEMRYRRDLARKDTENYTVWRNDWQNATPTDDKGLQAFPQHVECFIAQLADYKTNQNLLVASRQGILSVLIARLLSTPAIAMWHLRVEQGCWSAIDFCDDFAVLKMFNSRAVWHDGEWTHCFFCRRASLPLAPRGRLLFSVARLSPPLRALQRLSYKNGDAFCGVGWDDSALQRRFRKHLSRYRLWFRYTNGRF